MGSSDNTFPYPASLNGAGSHNSLFAGLPAIQAGAYAPLVGVPAANVSYTGNATVQDGPMAVVAERTASAACVFMSTDSTQFWTPGGFVTTAQANGLASAYLNTAASSGGPCEPLPSVPALPPPWTAGLVLALALAALTSLRSLGEVPRPGAG